MHFYPYSGHSNSQIMFAIRNTVNNIVSLQAEFDGTTGQVRINHWENSAWVYIFSTASTLTLGNISSGFESFLIYHPDIFLDTWNLVIFEIVQAQPASLGTGHCSVRIWINGAVSSTGTFGDFSSGITLFADINNAAIDICSTRNNGLSTRNSAKDGNYDVLNFLWYKGTETLFANSSGKKNSELLG